MGRPSSPRTERIDKVGIRRTGRLVQVGTAGRRVHLHLVGPAERIRQRGPRLHLPAPVEDMLRHFPHPPANLGRPEIAEREPRAVGNSSGQEPKILRVGLALEDRDRRGSGMSVRGRHEHMVGGKSGVLRHETLGFIQDFAGNHAAVDDRDDNAVAAVIQRQRTGVQLVVNLVDPTVLHVRR